MNTTKTSKTYAQFYSHVHSKAHSPRSREVYLRWVERLGEYYQPEGPGLRRLSERQVLDYLIYLRDDQKLAASTVNQALVPIRTLYRDVLERDWRLWSAFTLQRREPLPSVLTRDEVHAVLSCVHEGRFRAVLSLIYHSCNHRACPQCGGREQQLWAARQQARRLPVPYFMLTFTVPEQLRGFFLRHDRVAYQLFFAAVSGAVSELFADPKHFGGQAGFTAILHTWTRQMLFHPHLHLLVPAAALSPDGLTAIRAKNPDYLLPFAALKRCYKERFLGRLRDKHPGLYTELDSQIAKIDWNVNITAVGRGKKAIRYLAAYVGKSAFSEERLAGYDGNGRVRLWWRDSNNGKRKIITLEPAELIRRWLLHVLPKGLTRLRHFGYLAAAARRAYRGLRFLLGGKASGCRVAARRSHALPLL